MPFALNIVLIGLGSAQATSGDAWPQGLGGPFELDRVEHLRIPSFDGTMLDGVVAIPRLPAGVGAPVVLQVSPYTGTLDAGGEDPDQQATSGRSLPVPRDRLISEGYAVAFFNVRGAGASGGCFDFFGPREQQDT
ncbi:MAG: CocE/NonD family hydrolase, partial [Chloroflexi bacterium]|nr:CocE/NonD family hydrolase [Chloroflexota bacterium]